MSNELQKDDVVVAGGIGIIMIGGRPHEIIEKKTGIFNGFEGSQMMLHAIVPPLIKTEDAEFEVLPPNQLPPSNSKI